MALRAYQYKLKVTPTQEADLIESLALYERTTEESTTRDTVMEPIVIVGLIVLAIVINKIIFG